MKFQNDAIQAFTEIWMEMLTSKEEDLSELIWYLDFFLPFCGEDFLDWAASCLPYFQTIVPTNRNLTLLEWWMIKEQKKIRGENPMKHNTYICQECNGRIVTINDDCGTTAFMIKCRVNKRCNGMMMSSFGYAKPGTLATYEWYRREDVDKMNREDLDHHNNGGAFLRLLNKPVEVTE